MKNIGKTIEKNGIKTFTMSFKEIADLCAIDENFQRLWNNYKVKTSKDYIVKRYEELVFTRQIPSYIMKNKDQQILITCESNCEGNITRYPYRDFSLDLLTAYKFSVLQNYAPKECLYYNFDYIIRGQPQTKLMLPYGNLTE